MINKCRIVEARKEEEERREELLGDIEQSQGKDKLQQMKWSVLVL